LAKVAQEGCDELSTEARPLTRGLIRSARFLWPPWRESHHGAVASIQSNWARISWVPYRICRWSCMASIGCHQSVRRRTRRRQERRQQHPYREAQVFHACEGGTASTSQAGSANNKRLSELGEVRRQRPPRRTAPPAASKLGVKTSSPISKPKF